MRQMNKVRRLVTAGLAGGLLLQGCPLGYEELQLTVANSLELVLSDLLTLALSAFIDAAFNLDSTGVVGFIMPILMGT